VSIDPAKVLIYHITDIDNLAGIIAEGGMHSDTVMAKRNPSVIGYTHIKQRRLTQIQVPCCGGRFVGQFVPFYFCPRSPMLFTINKGNTGRPPGCQTRILHLVSTLDLAINSGTEWAVSDGNAGAFHTSFYNTLAAVGNLDWKAIQATNWQGISHQKQAELLVADFFAWTGFVGIGCHNQGAAQQVVKIIENQSHKPKIAVKSDWYY